MSKGKKKSGFISDFKKFVLEGNALNLAVGVIIGAAMKDLVNSLVNDIFGPIIGNFMGKVDFSELVINIGDEVTIKYGAFLTQLINFLIMAFVIFLVIRIFAKISNIPILKVTEEKTTKICPYCQSEINIKAVKCPHCASELTNKANSENIEKIVDKEEIE